jgi:hypothetical protein
MITDEQTLFRSNTGEAQGHIIGIKVIEDETINGWKLEIENKKIDNSLNDIKEVCKKHGLSISHEDGQGGFIIDHYSDKDIEWLFQASDKTQEQQGAKTN